VNKAVRVTVNSLVEGTALAVRGPRGQAGGFSRWGRSRRNCISSTNPTKRGSSWEKVSSWAERSEVEGSAVRHK